MATKKITLNELRNLVKQIIKESMNNGKGEYTIETLPLLLNKVKLYGKDHPEMLMLVSNTKFIHMGAGAPSFAIYNDAELKKWKDEVIKLGYKPESILRSGMGNMWYLVK